MFGNAPNGLHIKDEQDEMFCSFYLEVYMTREERKKQEKEIIDLRSQGKTYKEIATILGKDDHNIRKTCIRLGCEYKDGENKQGNTLDDVNRLVSNKGVEYVGGYTNNHGTVTIKGSCGHKWSLNFIFVYTDNKPTCPICASIERSKKERQKQIAKMRKESFTGKQERFRICPVCGALFVGKVYCSDKCARRMNNHKKEVTRRIKIREAFVDDVSLERLYAMDNGVCYLCGEKCDWTDGAWEDGVFIAGNMYPSIDHVIPLSKGGKHSWENVKLSHRICNTLKRDK